MPISLKCLIGSFIQKFRLKMEKLSHKCFMWSCKCFNTFLKFQKYQYPSKNPKLHFYWDFKLLWKSFPQYVHISKPLTLKSIHKSHFIWNQHYCVAGIKYWLKSIFNRCIYCVRHPFQFKIKYRTFNLICYG